MVVDIERACVLLVRGTDRHVKWIFARNWAPSTRFREFGQHLWAITERRMHDDIGRNRMRAKYYGQGSACAACTEHLGCKRAMHV